MARSRLLTGWLPVLIWAAVIFTLSSIPSLSTGLGTWDTILRKGAHLTEYAVLGGLLYRALGRERAPPAGVAVPGGRPVRAVCPGAARSRGGHRVCGDRRTAPVLRSRPPCLAC